MLEKKFSYGMGKTRMEIILFGEDAMSQVLALDHVTLSEQNGCFFIQTELNSIRLIAINKIVFQILGYLNTY